MRVAAYMYMYVGGGCTEPAELARKAAEQPAEWAAEGEGGQPRNTPGVSGDVSIEKWIRALSEQHVSAIATHLL